MFQLSGPLELKQTHRTGLPKVFGLTIWEAADFCICRVSILALVGFNFLIYTLLICSSKSLIVLQVVTSKQVESRWA